MPTTPKQRTWRGKLYPRYIVSGAIDFKKIQRIIQLPSSRDMFIPYRSPVMSNESVNFESLLTEKPQN